MKSFQYLSLSTLYPKWSTEISICSHNTLGKVDALSIFDNGIFSVVYCKDFGPIPKNPTSDKLIREPIEWSMDILTLAQVVQCQRFKTDHSWRVRNAEFLLPDVYRLMGLTAWIQEESMRASELRHWMESSNVDNVRDLLTKDT